MKKNNSPEDGIFVAIALALYELAEGNAHDNENMKLTIKRSTVSSAWGLKSNIMRELPKRNF